MLAWYVTGGIILALIILAGLGIAKASKQRDEEWESVIAGKAYDRYRDNVNE